MAECSESTGMISVPRGTSRIPLSVSFTDERFLVRKGDPAAVFDSGKRRPQPCDTDYRIDADVRFDRRGLDDAFPPPRTLMSVSASAVSVLCCGFIESAATLGLQRLAKSSISEWLLPAASEATGMLRRSSTSIACFPMEPVHPKTADCNLVSPLLLFTDCRSNRIRIS